MKRKQDACTDKHAPKKRSRAVDQSATATPPGTAHPVLRRLYAQVHTLRHYLLSQFPRSSKNRRRRVDQLGKPSATYSATDADIELGKLLDTVLIATGTRTSHDESLQQQKSKEREQEVVSFTQQRSPDSAGGTFKPGYFLQSEIVDFVVWRLFRRASNHRPTHLLCHGFQRSAHGRHPKGEGDAVTSSIPGLLERHPNEYVRAFKGPLWCRLHALLGQGGDRIMMDMLMDCAVFMPIEGDRDNYIQLCGLPISDVTATHAPQNSTTGKETVPAVKSKPVALHSALRTPGAITFVRSRVLYAKAALNAKGGIRFGMRHIHVLNRFPDRGSKKQTVHVMRHIFPRQYGLHNVFTSAVDHEETSMPFKDYTLREQEIHRSMCRELGEKATNAEIVERWHNRVPRRLRGKAVALVEKMRILNQRCSYSELLRHYCPVEGLPLSSGPEWKNNPLFQNTDQLCFTDMACPTAHVSAFCRAVVRKVMPQQFWGGDSNKHNLLHWIDQFVHLRKFESLTLHQVTQGIQITQVTWLHLPGIDETNKLSRTDLTKRQEIFLEFVYWLFDSFLIPLIRSNFHVTESNVHKHKLFYFRHDVWRMLSEPALTRLKSSMFEEMPLEQTRRLLTSRQLGFSKIRLLPKSHGFRTIMNLKRRQQIMRNGVLSLGRSINSIMTPVFNAITYEKVLQPGRFGGSLFSVEDMVPKLVAFKQSLSKQGLDEKPLYFAKVDVQSCFDTIPQSRVLDMTRELMSMETYRSGKHVEVSSIGALQRLDGQYNDPLPRKRYVTHSGVATETKSFPQLVQNHYVGTKSHTVFVNTNMQRSETKHDLMQLLREHVQRNLVQIGKGFYRQKTGIPQGSVLSSILCNFFYAELERDVLDFVQEEDCLLLRLLDDFLLITTNYSRAERFVHVMHRGHADYGVVIRSSKSLANFDVCTENGDRIAQSGPDDRFPYCGIHINTRTLEISKKCERAAAVDIEHSLTVDLSRLPGQTFHRKALNAFKIQLKNVLIDARLNSVSTILANLYQSFRQAAVRCLEYARVLSKVRTTCSTLLIKTIDNMIALSYVMLQRRSVRHSDSKVKLIQNVISRRHLQWLACKAFQEVFQRKQTQHGGLLAWLQAAIVGARASDVSERSLLEEAIG
ncbi:Telomerase reverse transcriptase [Coniothyrium glycines]